MLFRFSDATAAGAEVEAEGKAESERGPANPPLTAHILGDCASSRLSSIRISDSIRAQRLCSRCPFSFIEFFTLTTFTPGAQFFILLAAILFLGIIYLFCADFMRLP